MSIPATPDTIPAGMPLAHHPGTSDRPIALVTGATRGFGRAIAQLLAPDHHLVIGGRDPEIVQLEAATYPSAEPFVADLNDAAATQAAVDRLLEAHDHIDVLVHNAGIASRGTVETTTRETWSRLMETDVVAVADLTRMLLPTLRRSRATVIAINSGAGFRAFPSDVAYCAAKFALRAFTDALREGERGSLRVTSIHPGRMDTDMQVQLQGEDGRPYDAAEHMRAEDVARAVRLAVDLPWEATMEVVEVRPTLPQDSPHNGTDPSA